MMSILTIPPLPMPNSLATSGNRNAANNKAATNRHITPTTSVNK